MIKHSAIRIIEADATGQCDWGAEGEIIRLILDVLGERTDLVIAVGEEQARLADMVPPARAISAKIAEKVSEQVRLN
ncbi:MAG: hypothetical protein JXN61_07700, partial [Sedimentisphaerales bacterium]|nr:hypothetical protein [Sedimentisphaerales bacterium]